MSSWYHGNSEAKDRDESTICVPTIDTPNRAVGHARSEHVYRDDQPQVAVCIRNADSCNR